MRNSDDVLLQAIFTAPDDDEPRLKYAAWLDDRADPEGAARAEFIRLQCTLQTEQVRREPLEDRLRQLLGAHRDDWITQEWPGASAPSDGEEVFERGLVTRVSLSGRGLDDADLQHLAATQRLKLLTFLDLSENRFGAAGLRALANSPHVSRLRVLDLRENDFPLDALRALASSPHLSRLRLLPLGLPSDENWQGVLEPLSPGHVGQETVELVGAADQCTDLIQSWFGQHGKGVSLRNLPGQPEPRYWPTGEVWRKLRARLPAEFT